MDKGRGPEDLSAILQRDAAAGVPTSSVDRPVPETPHSYLRRETRPLHDEVERAFAHHDLATLAGLSAFLLHQARAVLPLEAALADAGAHRLVPDWPERLRGAALLADLARLGVDAPPLTQAPEIPTRLHALGAMYVLEGSRLGGRLLHRRVVASPDPRVRAADAFLNHRIERGWPSFLAVLDASATSTGDLEMLAAGAALAFSQFLPASSDRRPILPTRSRLDRHADA